jgi:hypothetical protein
MARRYANPATDKTLAEAQARVEAARERLRAVEQGDPTAFGCDAELAGAEAAVRAAERRVTALEALLAERMARSGKRAEVAKAAGGDLKSMATSLAASRDQVAAAWAELLRVLGQLAVLADAHNQALASARDRLASLGLATQDDLVPDGEHAEGTLPAGVRAEGTDWTPIPALGLADHAMQAVFTDRTVQAGRFRWRAHEVTARADQLKVPSLAAMKVTLPAGPQPLVARAAPLERPAAGLAEVGGYYPPKPPRPLPPGMVRTA